MTGADPAAFAGIGASGEIFDVENPARITRALLIPIAQANRSTIAGFVREARCR